MINIYSKNFEEKIYSKLKPKHWHILKEKRVFFTKRGANDEPTVKLYKYLLFIKVNPEANVCPNFNLILMVNFTLIPLFNY